jgi:hypothetical protein
MTQFRCRTFGGAAFVMLASVHAVAQGADPEAIVDQFYPQSLIDVSQQLGIPFSRNQCVAVYDTDADGGPRTIVAGYSNGYRGIVRVLRPNGAAFSVVAEPVGYEFSGHQCDITLVDIDGDGAKEVRVSYLERIGSVDWIFGWNGQQLLDLTPSSLDATGERISALRNMGFVDIDNDGTQEVLSSWIDRDEPPSPNDLYRLSGGVYSHEQPVVALMTFPRFAEPFDFYLPIPEGARGPYSLRVINGIAGGRARVTSGQVWLNGQEIVSVSDLGAAMDFIDRIVSLQAGNRLSVRVNDPVSSQLTILITSAVWDTSLGYTRLWLGLTDVATEGANFDLLTEVYRNGTLLTSGYAQCIRGAAVYDGDNVEALTFLEPFSPVSYTPGDVLSLKVRARMGTTADGASCSTHGQVSGLKVYYDGVDRASRINLALASASPQDFFLHKSGSADVLSETAPTSIDTIFVQAPTLNFSGGNPWQDVGTWTLTPP